MQYVFIEHDFIYVKKYHDFQMFFVHIPLLLLIIIQIFKHKEILHDPTGLEPSVCRHAGAIAIAKSCVQILGISLCVSYRSIVFDFTYAPLMRNLFEIG